MLRNVDELALAGVQTPEQRRRNAQGRVQSGFVVGEESAGPLQRRPRGIGMAGRVIPPAAGVEHVDALGVVELGGRALAERGDRAEHYARVSLGPGRRVVVDDRVSGGDQLMQPLDVGRRGDVKNDGPLVRIEVGEQCAAFAPGAIVENGRHRPSGAAAPRRLDLDHLGTEIGQQLPAVLPRDRLG